MFNDTDIQDKILLLNPNCMVFVYCRYIEGLTSDRATMCNWDKQLNSSKENTRTDEAKLPAHWLADNGEHATSLDALWALRDFLVQDSLGVVKILDHASL